jgi:hypothetical protein
MRDDRFVDQVHVTRQALHISYAERISILLCKEA